MARDTAIVTQAQVIGLKTTDSPTFAGAVIGTLTGLLKWATGTVSVATDGTDYLSRLTGEAKLATVNSIDLKATGQTTLFTVPAGKSCIPTKAVIRITASDTASVGATITIGVNAASFNDFIGSTITGLLSLGQFGIIDGLLSTTTGSKVYAAADVIKFNVGTGATATTLTASVDLFGYLI